MQEYNNGISQTLMNNVYRGIIKGTPQPDMLGGKRARLHPKAGLTQYDYPSTLAVGSRKIHQPDLLGAGFWKDFGKGFKQGLVGSAQVAAPILGEVAKDAAASYLRGGVARKRGGKYSIGKFFKDAGDVLHPIYKEVAPVAKDVAVSVAKDAIKSYLKGGAMLSNNPNEFHRTTYPKALQSYHPMETHSYGGRKIDYDSDSDDEEMTGGDLKHYWAAVKALSAQQGISTKEARLRIKDKLEPYAPTERKKRGHNKRTTSERKKKVTSQTKAAIAHLLQYAPVKKPRAKKAVDFGMSGDMFDPSLTQARKSNAKAAVAKLLKKGSGRHNFLDDAVKVSKAVAPYVPLMMMAAGRKQLPRSGHKREVARGDIVAAVMKQQGISLPQASKYVKDNGLY
jgi:hypothetical protein